MKPKPYLGPKELARILRAFISIRSGVPSLDSFKRNALDLFTTLAKIATKIEETAERFNRRKTHLCEKGLYYRFNVNCGLEDVRLEDSKKLMEITAATRRYVMSEDVLKDMQACVKSSSGQG